MTNQNNVRVSGNGYQWQRKDFLYEGKAKKIYECELVLNSEMNDTNSSVSVSQFVNIPSEELENLKKDKCIWIEYKNSLTAFNALKKGEFQNKGLVNHNISGLIYKYLKKNQIRSHLIQEFIIDNNTAISIVKKLQMIPLEIVVRNYVAGSLAKKMGLTEGTTLKRPLVEFYYKSDALADPFLSEEQILVLDIIEESVLKKCKTLALAVNENLKELMIKSNLKLIDFKIEAGFSLDQNQNKNVDNIILADELSPDCMRLWDVSTNMKMDKDRFRQDLGQVEDVYKEVLNRLEKVVV